ncbi:MAG: 3-dehydroquinate synthase [Flavobacteriales bacterium]|nr:3-dehydroquinate synthase [Flavobacteriales bacterium]
MTPLDVRLFDADGCPVACGTHALAALEGTIAAWPGTPQTFILGDDNTLRDCLPELLAHVPALRDAPTIAIPPGETSKRIAMCEAVWEHLAEEAAGRDAVLICLGGGVVTDLGGFVAGAYKRGIRHIHVPTTLMGMADAAIGAKTAVDLAGVKNIVGLFHKPLGVFVHLPFLRTLGKRELLNGLAEMIKHGLVCDAAHWAAIVDAPLHDLEALAPLVERSVAIKAAVVSGDPLEQGPRRLLNFGHTIGHALEAQGWEGGRHAPLHGEAVVAGMICAAWLSTELGQLPAGDRDRITSHLMGLFKHIPSDTMDDHRLLELMRNDKKNSGDGFRFTLLEAIGRGRIDMRVDADQVRQALDHYRSITAHV